MTLEEKLIYFKEKGYVYDHITGLITSPRGIVISGKSRGHINLNTKINQVNINVKGHQFAWYMYYNEISTEIDHINRIRDDNRIMNLRNVTRQINQWNRNPKGYYWNKYAKKYQATITLNNKHIHLGYFNTEKDAHQAYLNAKKIYHII